MPSIPDPELAAQGWLFIAAHGLSTALYSTYSEVGHYSFTGTSLTVVITHRVAAGFVGSLQMHKRLATPRVKSWPCEPRDLGDQWVQTFFAATTWVNGQRALIDHHDWDEEPDRNEPEL